MAQYVYAFTKQLGVWDVFQKNGHGIFTNDLQSKSGSNYHLLVLAFRMAYAASVEGVCNIKLPLIIDSVRGRELNTFNFEASLNLLSEQMRAHQRIVASISDFGIKADETIVLRDCLMRDAVTINDLKAWEEEAHV